MITKDIKVLKRIKVRIEAAKKRAYTVRNELRELEYELEAIRDSFTEGCDNLDTAIRSIEDAVAEMSKHV